MEPTPSLIQAQQTQFDLSAVGSSQSEKEKITSKVAHEQLSKSPQNQRAAGKTKWKEIIWEQSEDSAYIGIMTHIGHGQDKTILCLSSPEEFSAQGQGNIKKAESALAIIKEDPEESLELQDKPQNKIKNADEADL